MSERKKTAIHEAGHAVAHFRLGVQQHRASIKRGDGILGAVIAEGKEHVWGAEDAQPQVLCYCAGYAALKAAGYSDQEASLGAGGDFENAAELLATWPLDGTLDEWRSRSVALMTSAENIRAVEFVAKALMDYEALDTGYMDVLVEKADGNVSEDEWRQFVSWQYPGMI